jgi:outer membrane protein OmpA-like peptidoglycan-associated protein
MPGMNMVAKSSAGATAAARGVAETREPVRSQDRGKSLPTRTCGLAAIALAVGLSLSLLSAPASAQKTAEELAQQYGREAVEHALETKRHYDLYGIHFDSDTATIQSQTQPLLDDIAEMLEDFPNWRLQIVGHTDSTGDPAHNERLSSERAAAVKAALVDRGIQAARLEFAGAGESEPVASNDTPEGRALNRRVELVRLESVATAYSTVTDARLKNPEPENWLLLRGNYRDGCIARSARSTPPTSRI